MTAKFLIKTNRTFTIIRKYGFIFTLAVAIGGLWYPKLGLLVFGVIIGLLLFSFYKGRYWCGNICAHGSLFDSLLLPFSKNTKIPKFFKSKLLSTTFFLWFGYRLTSKFILVAGLYGTLPFWDKMGFIFVNSYLMVTIIGGILAILISPRTWCNFCPMGVMQKISYSIGKKINVTKTNDEKVTIIDKNMCHKCGKCSRVCPIQLSPYDNFSDQNQFDNINCLKCSTCVVHCPANILTMATENTSNIITKNYKNENAKNRQRIIANISKVFSINNDINEYTFKLITPTNVMYKPGQFILVKIKNDPEMFRAFSISSFNANSNELSIAIKKAKDGYGTEIIFDTFIEGREIILEGPIGDELIVDKNAKKVLLVAGGIGITPFLPIVTDIIQNRNDISEVKLLYGVNKEDEFIYSKEFKELEKQNNKFEFIKIVAFDDTWNGKKGFVTDHMQDIDLENYKVYMCGPLPMINASKQKLKSLNVKDENINYESA